MTQRLLTVLMLVLPGFGLLAAEPSHLMVEDAYVRGLPPTATNTAAYMRLVNHGDESLTLVGASSPVARRVMLHETYDDDGLVGMRHVGRVEVPAHGEIHLRSGGMHLMLMELLAPVVEGNEVQVTLEFADGSSRELLLPVRSVMSENAGPDHRH